LFPTPWAPSLLFLCGVRALRTWLCKLYPGIYCVLCTVVRWINGKTSLTNDKHDAIQAATTRNPIVPYWYSISPQSSLTWASKSKIQKSPVYEYAVWQSARVLCHRYLFRTPGKRLGTRPWPYALLDRLALNPPTKTKGHVENFFLKDLRKTARVLAGPGPGSRACSVQTLRRMIIWWISFHTVDPARYELRYKQGHSLFLRASKYYVRYVQIHQKRNLRYPNSCARGHGYSEWQRKKGQNNSQSDHIINQAGACSMAREWTENRHKHVSAGQRRKRSRSRRTGHNQATQNRTGNMAKMEKKETSGHRSLSSSVSVRVDGSDSRQKCHVSGGASITSRGYRVFIRLSITDQVALLVYSEVGIPSTSSLRALQLSACSSAYLTRSWLQSWCRRLMWYWLRWK